MAALVVQAVIAAGDVAVLLAAHGEEVAALEGAYRGLVEAARDADGVLAAVLAIGERFAIEGAARDDGGVNARLRIGAIAHGEEHVAIRQIDALMAACVRLDDRMPGVILLRHGHDLHAGPVLRLRRIDRIGHALLRAVVLGFVVVRIGEEAEAFAGDEQLASSRRAIAGRCRPSRARCRPGNACG